MLSILLCVLVDHWDVFFGNMSIYYPFYNWIAFLLSFFVSFMSSLNSLHNHTYLLMVCKYFLLLHVLPFHFVDYFFHRAVFTLDVIPLIASCFCYLYFWCHPKKLLPRPMAKRFIPPFLLGVYRYWADRGPFVWPIGEWPNNQCWEEQVFIYNIPTLGESRAFVLWAQFSHESQYFPCSPKGH